MIKIKRSTERSHHILIKKENLSETYSGKHLIQKSKASGVFGLRHLFNYLLQSYVVVREQECSSDFEGHYPWLKSFPRISVIRKVPITIQLREKRKKKKGKEQALKEIVNWIIDWRDSRETLIKWTMLVERNRINNLTANFSVNEDQCKDQCSDLQWEFTSNWKCLFFVEVRGLKKIMTWPGSGLG